MFKFLKEGLSPKAKMIAAAVLIVVVAGGGLVGWKLWDFKENNPKFCVGCHLMDEAYNKWAESAHKEVNCHACHHLTFVEQNMLLVNLVLKNPKEVEERHGKIIVPWKYCTQCHWEKNEEYPDAVNVSNSPMHAKHFFMEKIECSNCHGREPHEFRATSGLCASCHPDKEKIHGMEGLECLGCHTDKTLNLMPSRGKCLTCHGSKEQREKIAAEPQTGDVKIFTADPAQVETASRMSTFPEDAPMSFECSVCHKPHTKIKLVGNQDCLKCHSKQLRVGKHGMHIENGFKCLDCHKPHEWRVSKATLKSGKCTACHEPGNPKNFLE
ncbi:MAG TPA: cytochrome c3 family protein [Nitrospirota bacterium]